MLEGEPLRFDWRPMIRQIVSEKEQGVPTGILAARFMNTLIRMAVEMARRIAREAGIRDVVLSGGSFQNMYILHRLPGKLREEGLRVYHHSRVSANDEGLSLGQLMVAEHRRKKD